MKFGDNLRKLRKSKKISQEELASKVGVSRQSVSKWETSEAYPEMNNILELCKIFHCKINDLVNDSIVDLDSLDEEIKLSVVKLKKETQKQMKCISKIIYIFGRIGKIMSIIGIFGVILAMVIIPIFASNIRFRDENRIEVFDKEIKYNNKDENIVLSYEGKEYELTSKEQVFAFNTVIEKLENSKITVMTCFIEISFVLLIVTLVLLCLAMKHLENLFMNIHNGDTPFTIENVEHIKKLAIFMILTIIIPNISVMLTEVIINTNLGIGFELLDLIYILFLFSMVLIFEYGYEIQLDSNGKMYGDQNE